MDTNSTPATKPDVKPVYAARKLLDYFRTDVERNIVRSGQTISIAVIRLFEAAAIWEIKQVHPDSKQDAIMQVVPFLGINCNKMADIIAGFFVDIKDWNSVREDNHTLPFYERLKTIYPNAALEATKKGEMAGLLSACILAICYEPAFKSRNSKLSDTYSEINSAFVKAGFDGAPAFVLSFVNNIYKVVK